MKTHLLKTSQGIALEINGVVSDCKLEFSEEVSKGIGELWGIFDVEKLACSYANYPYPLPYGYTGAANDFKNGFQAAQRLNKEKLFTREDMLKAIEFGEEREQSVYWADPVIKTTDNEFLSSLLPDRVECTVEMEENQCDGCKANLPLIGNVHQCSYPTGNISCQKEKYNRPKITDGKYRVLTLIKN